MKVAQIYRPIEKELKAVGEILEASLEGSRNESILKLNRFLLESPGKRLRPALVILCAKASSNSQLLTLNSQLTKIASAMELIHMASLIHDDAIDHAFLRHHRPTINSKWGEDISIGLGDYLYSVAFELISHCGNPNILNCISSATKAMCEGELIQVCERDNLSLSKEKYILIVKKKTASLFAASCQAGAMLFGCQRPIQNSLKEYGLNFGIAFQIIDDCLDLISQKEELGKSPGADFKMGELTLPILNLLSQSKERGSIISLIRQQDTEEAFKELKQRFINSCAFLKTKEIASSYIQNAKRHLHRLRDSYFKQSLFSLADYIMERL